MLFRACAAAVLVSSGVIAVAAQSDPPRATFRSSLDLVSVAVIVRDSDGRLMTGLKPTDFEVLDCGKARPIAQFQQGDGADARLALLVDSSGSMVVGGKRQRSQLATELLLAAFSPRDTASVFTFDKRLRRLTPFTHDLGVLQAAVESVEPFGVTSIYDAIVGTINTVMEDMPRARALLLLTDGHDTASVLSPRDAASAAAALDIPLYVLSVSGAQPRLKVGPKPVSFQSAPHEALALSDLAERTGGLATAAVTPAQLSVATRAILNELRHQYVLAFPAGSERGWHELTVRVRRGRVQARSRNGYLVS